MTPRMLTLAAVGGLFSVSAFASDFDALDADGSGALSLAEIQNAAPDVTAEAFAAADADGSGELSRTEFDAWMAATAEPME